MQWVKFHRTLLPYLHDTTVCKFWHEIEFKIFFFQRSKHLWFPLARSKRRAQSERLNRSADSMPVLSIFWTNKQTDYQDGWIWRQTRAAVWCQCCAVCLWDGTSWNPGHGDVGCHDSNCACIRCNGQWLQLCHNIASVAPWSREQKVAYPISYTNTMPIDEQ